VDNIGLIGAAGAIGKSIAEAFEARGLEYCVIGRGRAALEAAFGDHPLARIATWDPDNPESTQAALRGLDAAVYLVGVRYDQFQLHPILMRKTVDAAIKEGVSRLVLIGTVYPYGKPQTTPVTEDHPRQPHTFKGRMRKEQEDVLLAAHEAGTIQGSVLRLPDFYGPGVDRSFLDSLIQAAATGGTANLLSPIDKPHEFVFVPDVGPVVAALLDQPRAWGRMWNLAGAGAVTERHLADVAFRLAGTKPRIRVAGKNMLRLLGLFNFLMREMVEMHYLWTTPVLMDDSALHGLLGNIQKTSYEEGLRLSIEAARRLKQKKPGVRHS
jgi:nucleoside-diphosphate-sugar epimerase